jgi:hypothetical protein
VKAETEPPAGSVLVWNYLVDVDKDEAEDQDINEHHTPGEGVWSDVILRICGSHVGAYHRYRVLRHDVEVVDPRGKVRLMGILDTESKEQQRHQE